MNNEAYERSVRALGETPASLGTIVVAAAVPATSYHWPESVGITDFVVAPRRV